MGYNIFVSYKYGDDSVQTLSNNYWTQTRDYVNILEEELKKQGNVYMGERKDEDLSGFSEEYIYNHLKDKIFRTSITIVLISPQMKRTNSYDRSQWIPWEIYYSLRETPRNDMTSRRNGILAVVLPDKWGRYDYMLEDKHCCSSGCVIWHRNKLFTILSENMFNEKNSNNHICEDGSKIHYGLFSYIRMIKWKDFMNDIQGHLDTTDSIRKSADNYELHISVNKN